jgi:hypothetical protein
MTLLTFQAARGYSALLSGFPFIGHGNPDNNLESPCIASSNGVIILLIEKNMEGSSWSERSTILAFALEID